MNELTEVDKIMIRIYVSLVENGRRKLESVPEKLREYVKKELEN